MTLLCEHRRTFNHFGLNVRLWISGDLNPVEVERDVRQAVGQADSKQTGPTDIKALTEAVAGQLGERINAIEITDHHEGNGAVVYVNWP